MKLNKFAIALTLVATASPTLAQNFTKDSSIDERIEFSNKDSVQVGRGYISLFQQSLQNQEYAEARINLQWLLKNAPYAITGIYTQGPFVYYSLITAEQDANKKLQYFQEMMDLFEARQKNLDVLNSFSKNTSTLGDVLSLKADYYNWTAPIVANSGYTLNQSYANYSEAIKMINEKGGREIEGSVLQNFFLVSDAMYKSAPNTLREQYLQDYLDSKDACEKMLQLAKEAKANGDDEVASKLVAKYDGPLAFIEQTFSASGAADREQIHPEVDRLSLQRQARRALHPSHGRAHDADDRATGGELLGQARGQDRDDGLQHRRGALRPPAAARQRAALPGPVGHHLRLRLLGAARP